MSDFLLLPLVICFSLASLVQEGGADLLTFSWSLTVNFLNNGSSSWESLCYGYRACQQGTRWWVSLHQSVTQEWLPPCCAQTRLAYTGTLMSWTSAWVERAIPLWDWRINNDLCLWPSEMIHAHACACGYSVEKWSVIDVWKNYCI